MTVAHGRPTRENHRESLFFFSKQHPFAVGIRSRLGDMHSIRPWINVCLLAIPITVYDWVQELRMLNIEIGRLMTSFAVALIVSGCMSCSSVWEAKGWTQYKPESGEIGLIRKDPSEGLSAVQIHGGIFVHPSTGGVNYGDSGTERTAT